jgi:glycosyltransferase involved in cell wall biosynthesis
VLVGLPALRVARRRRLPFVYEVRDLWENASVDRGRFRESSPLYRVARSLESRVLERADAVVTICEALRAELAPRAGRPDKVHVVANGVDTVAFSPGASSEAALGQHGLAGKRVVLYAGTFQPYEGLELLARAMPVILRHVPDAHLVIAGGSVSLQYAGSSLHGTQEEALAALVSELGVGKSVTMTGRLPYEAMNGLYAAADVVVYPRLLTRTTALTTPLKPLEAMAAGRAVIVSDLPPMRELVRDQDVGLCFPAGDVGALAGRCVEVLGSPQLRDSLGRAARALVVAERQWPSLVAAYPGIYRAAQARGRL